MWHTFRSNLFQKKTILYLKLIYTSHFTLITGFYSRKNFVMFKAISFKSFLNFVSTQTPSHKMERRLSFSPFWSYEIASLYDPHDKIAPLQFLE